tara:strand:+ start:661 stop:870 length:210 start_codon:yes stop_codon:yes gene_type:complete
MDGFESINQTLDLTASIDEEKSLQSMCEIDDSLDGGQSIIQDKETGAPVVNPKFRRAQVHKIVGHFFKP